MNLVTGQSNLLRTELRFAGVENAVKVSRLENIMQYPLRQIEVI
jgi:hypothetical protein